MEQVVFKQLEFVRGNTLRTVANVTEEMADRILPQFNNNIRWNLGHIYVILEKFAFHFAQLPMQLPEGFLEWFDKDTKPANWNTQPPALPELIALLQEQPKRIREALAGRLNEKVANPLTTSTGLTLETIGEYLNFNLYHEGMHFHSIATYVRLLK